MKPIKVVVLSFTVTFKRTVAISFFIVSLLLGWNELLIAGFSHRSIGVQDTVLLATGLRVNRDSANEAGIGAIFDRVQVELVAKMREMKMDKTELGCLRAIVLFNPGMYTSKRVQCNMFRQSRS